MDISACCTGNYFLEYTLDTPTQYAGYHDIHGANLQLFSSVHSLFLEQTKCYFYLSECCHLFVVLYVKGLNWLFSLRSHFTKNKLSLTKTVSPAAALTLQKTVFHGLCSNHAISISTATGVWLIIRTKVLYTWTKRRMKETSDYGLWVIKNLEVGGRKVRESTITTFICQYIVK